MFGFRSLGRTHQATTTSPSTMKATPFMKKPRVQASSRADSRRPSPASANSGHDSRLDSQYERDLESTWLGHCDLSVVELPSVAESAGIVGSH